MTRTLRKSYCGECIRQRVLDSEAPDGMPSTWPSGPGYVCFDAGPLMQFHRHGFLDVLGEWFPKGFTADVIIQEEVLGQRALARYPKNPEIAAASWLHSVEVREARGHRIVHGLRSLWKSAPDKDRGEAEVIALCEQYGWSAVMNDEQGRAAARKLNSLGLVKDARRFGVLNTLSLLIGAAAQGLVTEKVAWEMHRSLHVDGGTVLTVQQSHRRVFRESVQALSRRTKERGYNGWPWILAARGLDDVPLITRRRSSD